MAFDGIVVANLVHELRAELLDARINKIAQPEKDELLITCKTTTGLRRLLLSASASLPLLYLTQENKQSPMNAPNFCMLLRKHIGSARIIDIYQPKMERVVVIVISHFDELGDLRTKKLILELMGKHSNLIFTDEEDRIIDSIKHVSSNMSSIREVLPGRDYFIPETMQKLDPLHVTYDDFMRKITSSTHPLSKTLYMSFNGISPIVAEEMCFQMGLDADLLAHELHADLLLHIYNQFILFMKPVADGTFAPTIYYQGEEPKDFSSIPISHYHSYTSVPMDSSSQMIETYYAEKNAYTRIRQKSTELRQIVQIALDRNRKKYGLQRKQLQDTESRDKFRVYGELLMTYGYDVEEGSKECELPNYYEENRLIRIPLDPMKSPKENANKYFDRYNKLKRTYEALTELVEETKDEVLYLESIQNALEISISEQDLAEIKEELTETGYIKKRLINKKRKIHNQPLRYVSSDGYDIYVGKNNLQNDTITFEVATGNDWWFHVKGAAGSHVILKCQGKTHEQIPAQTFEEAGRLAVYYSSMRSGSKVEVDYIEKKHVKRPKGGKPGFVVYYTNYSMVIDGDIRGITKIV